MNPKELLQILEKIERRELKPEDALADLAKLPFADIECAKFDTHRALRNGFTETVLCEGKNLNHLIKIAGEVVKRGYNLFATRAEEKTGNALKEKLEKGEYDPISRTFTFIQHPIEPLAGKLSIICAGTADIPVAEEARRTAKFFGIEALTHYDVGVAGLHRVLSRLDDLRAADAVIVAAGMEGALPSVVGGLTQAPIIAVPTSVGYGVSLKGVTALFSMLSSCSEGISVVNIDDGFDAACAALRILRRIAKIENSSGDSSLHSE